MSFTADQIRQSILDGLKQIAPEADLQSLGDTADFRQSLEIDSFDFLRLLIGLNERLGIDFPEADYGKLTNLQSLIAYILAKQT